jgi:hypothetical protein
MITFSGPPIDDAELLGRCPPNLAEALRRVNGFILHGGGLHVRGACLAPDWHSLRDAWLGEAAFHRLYPGLRPDDVPFAQDCVGNQFLLRDGSVLLLDTETSEIEDLEVDLATLLEASADPERCIGMETLSAFRAQGGSLSPGELLSVYPPFCSKEAEDGVSVQAVPAHERRAFLADFAGQIRDVADGEQIRIDVVE